VGFVVFTLGTSYLYAQEAHLFAENFTSTGDFIQGWYWLRDPEFTHISEWVFENLSPGSGNLVLEWEVLATDRMNGPRRVDAHFFISYGIPPSQGRGRLIVGVRKSFSPMFPRPMIRWGICVGER